jgi:hypothetical protein
MVDSLRGLFTIDSLNIYNMHLYFIIFKSKKEKDYKLFTNTIFDKEIDANEFGRKSMKRGFEYKVLEYNKDNMDKYWYDK